MRPSEMRSGEVLECKTNPSSDITMTTGNVTTTTRDYRRTPIKIKTTTVSKLIELPPKIQPQSGFMGNSKVVIRPIAFKPTSNAMMNGRLSNNGERYSSTPLLTSRPGSHLTLYGSSSDLRSRGATVWSCISPQPCSLPTEHHHNNISSKHSISSSACNTIVRSSKGSSPAPSPSDSGVSELAFKDTEIHHARPCNMEQHQHYSERANRYQDKERTWDRELRRLKTSQDASRQQKTMKLEQVLMMQQFQLQQEKRRLSVDSERMGSELADLKKDTDSLKTRLEETEWNLCQKTGEIAFLKTQLKDSQHEQTIKGHEYLQLKSELRHVREIVEWKDKEISKLKLESEEKDKTIKQLQTDVNRLNYNLKSSENELSKSKDTSFREIERLKSDLKELREELSDMSLNGYDGIESGRKMRGIYDKNKNGDFQWNSNDSSLEDAEVQRLIGNMPHFNEPCQNNALLERLKCEMQNKELEYQSERAKWSEEKEKVLRYQKQLQENYVKMLRRTRTLETEIESLRLELELCNKNMKNLSQFGKTIHL